MAFNELAPLSCAFIKSCSSFMKALTAATLDEGEEGQDLDGSMLAGSMAVCWEAFERLVFTTSEVCDSDCIPA
jgi:hypothetical protein